ncbi:hypothetical protein O9H85_18105 [Paenibacillus filicis]|uniref:Thiazole-containing bacteriocin maturation protein n=1 Tax=Paenibacillus gyeongsangnamensis TaxID=3388067 RepID=A0ABT4QBS2_9BACL|nr:hypothetical protein [Paenibacillus filicis]MCZ8514306.1 hypothetical protein [Paenibacillus filicis]
MSQEEEVLAVGSGSILLSLAESCFESGLSKFTVFVTNSQPTDTAKLTKLWEHALHNDPGALLNILTTTDDEDPNWRTIVRPYSFIFYVSQHGDLEELQKLQNACIEERKQMLPALALRGKGMAGPLLHPDGYGRFESAWRRIHSSVFPEERDQQLLSAAAADVLSNLIVYEWHKTVAGEKEPECKNQCFILDPVTLTGNWHPLLAHPLVSGYETACPVENIEQSLERSHEPMDPEEWFSCFNRLTSPVTGVFHVWEEADLIQLPLAQCLVQPVDLLSEGPAHLLPAIVRSGLTHEEARLESGLAGLEAYAARMKQMLFSGLPSYQREGIGIGAGCTIAEAVGRGLRSCLTKELDKRMLPNELVVTRIVCTHIEDIRCRYYLRALSIIEGEPIIAVGEPLLGFPVVWVYSGSSWYGSVDLSLTHALRQSLQKALNKTARVASSSAAVKDHEAQDITIPNSDPMIYAPLVLSAIQTLKQHQKRLELFDMRSGSLLGKGTFLIYGVLLGEEEIP